VGSRSSVQPSMRRLGLALIGALLVVGGIAALVVASRHHPHTVFVLAPGAFDPSCAPGHTSCPNGHYATAGFSRTLYDGVRIGGWALIVFGAVVVLFALSRELRPAR
jgi:hypothetical protein